MNATPAPESVRQGLAAIESSPVADTIAHYLSPVADRLRRSEARPVLRGEWLGHAAHPMLTDLPIGFFTSALVVDLLGGKRGAPAAQRLVGLGLLSLPAVAATGLVDWAEASDDEHVRKVGAVHAAGNLVAGFLYLRSWQARRRGRRWSGVLFGVMGAAAASGAGYLGGHLANAKAVGTGERGLHEPSEDAYPQSDWSTPEAGPTLDVTDSMVEQTESAGASQARTEDLISEAPIPR